MRNSQRCLVTLSLSLLAILVGSQSLTGQASAPVLADGPGISDWSQHHVIFSKPASSQQEQRLLRDPRYRQHLARTLPPALLEDAAIGALVPPLPFDAARGGAELPAHKGDWSQSLGSGASVGATNYPAKYSFRINSASCAKDFVVFGTGLASGVNQAGIVGFNNLYSGCGGTVPSVYWAYDTGGTAVTSPVFSRDGTQIAFVQSGGGYKSTLVLLKWAASNTESVTSPLTLVPTLRNLYPSCVAPCMTLIALSNGAGGNNKDSGSSVFYDYDNDVAYVGDDNGFLHEFTPFFNGAPTAILSGGWPIQVNPTAPTPLTSPVHDFVTGNILVADAGGFLYLVNPNTAAVTTSGQLDFSLDTDFGPGIVQGPIVDSNAGSVYVFVTSDGSNGCPIGIGGSDCTAVYQLSASFSSGNTGSAAIIGSSTAEPTAPNPLYIGTFDNAYETSLNATGHLYVCGNTGSAPILYQIAIGNGVMGTVTAGPSLNSGLGTPPACSPVTDVSNPNATGGTTEWVYASVENAGVSNACASGGCIFDFKDTPWLPSTVYSVGQEILDSNLHIEVVVGAVGAGKSGAVAPFWNISIGGISPDNNITWLDQGPLSAVTVLAWIKNHTYSKSAKILDANNNVELVTAVSHGTTCVSGGTTPAFSGTAGITTADNTCTWTNVGALAAVAAPEAGGTSGIVIDNVVGSSTEAGASNIYFSTLGDQACGTSGTGGCAVQASQAALQ